MSFFWGLVPRRKRIRSWGGVTWLVSPTFLPLTVSPLPIFHLDAPLSQPPLGPERIVRSLRKQSNVSFFFLLSTRLFSSPTGIFLFIFYLFYHWEADCVLGAFYRLAFIPFFLFTLKPVSLLLGGARLLLLQVDPGSVGSGIATCGWVGWMVGCT